MDSISGLITVEYSQKQKAFHITTLDNVIMLNQSIVANENPSDYLLIGLFKTWEQAQKFTREFQSATGIKTMQLL